MYQLIQLPSGLSVNLSLVSRVILLGDETLEVYFTGGDRVVLKGDDARAFRRRAGVRGSISSSVKTAIFWLVIIAAVVFVYWAVQRRA